MLPTGEVTASVYKGSDTHLEFEAIEDNTNPIGPLPLPARFQIHE